MRKIVVATLLSVFFAVPLVVSGGDDVDYSAPYLVVEDGELVTKYPAAEHDGASAENDVAPGETNESSAADVDTRNYWGIAGAVVIAIVAALVMIRRGRPRLKEPG